MNPSKESSTRLASKKVFITGIAGFIGFHLALALKRQGAEVIGCDNFNSYYPVSLKKDRTKLLKMQGIEVLQHDIRQLKALDPLFKEKGFTHFIHLAAQAGVRFSIENPHSYIQNNVEGFLEVLECVRRFKDMKLLFASSSSVYGMSDKVPFAEVDPTNSPVSLYAATKKSNELMAHSYHHLFKIHATGLRFFTVYGPYGRPDMAYFSFAKAIMENRPIDVYNEGNMRRDFTYIDDIVEGCIQALDLPFGCEIYNLGNNAPEPLGNLIQALEYHLNKKAVINFKPMQPGDVYETYADITKSSEALGFKPTISLDEGIKRFAFWFQTYFKLHDAPYLPAHKARK